MNFDPTTYFTQASKQRKPSAIRAISKYMATPGMISFGGGLPNPSLFPISSLSLEINNSDVTLTPEETQQMLQYGQTKGYPPLVSFIKNLQQKVHAPKVDFDIILGNGSQDLITKCIEMLIENDDILLIEEPTYVGVLAFLKPLKTNVISVKTDHEGIVIESLQEILSSKKVKCLYTVPNGGNPTGVTQSLQRKLQVYDLCKKYGVLILEDDPYFYLQYEEKIKSYLALDNLGIVIRFDSFSKCISGGLRMGFMTAHPLFIERIELHKQATDLHSSGASMMVVWKTLELLTLEGFLQNCVKVSSFYKARGTVFCSLIDKYLSGKVEYVRPQCGMFVWLKLLGIKDSFSFVENECREAMVLLLPGKVFYWDEDRVTNYCRASFSVASDADMELGIKRLAELLK